MVHNTITEFMSAPFQRVCFVSVADPVLCVFCRYGSLRSSPQSEGEEMHTARITPPLSRPDC